MNIQARALPTATVVRQHYDALFWPYLLFWGHHLHHGLFLTGRESPREAQVTMLRHCVSLLPSAPNGHVLDIGCGYGATSLFFAREFGCRVQGISVSGRQVAHARLKARREGLEDLTDFVIADAEQMQFPRAAFDLIWVMESSEHFSDRPRFFRRAAKSIRKGGALLLAAWSASDNAEPQALARVAEAAICPVFSRVQDYSSMLARAGLTVLLSRDLTYSVVKTWEIICPRIRKLRLLAHLTSSSVREFSEKIGLIHEAFRKRLLTYQLWVVVPDQGVRSQTPSRSHAARLGTCEVPPRSSSLTLGAASSAPSEFRHPNREVEGDQKNGREDCPTITR